MRRRFAEEDGGEPAQRLLALGSLIHVKGFDTTIRALAAGVRAGHNWRLSIAGEGPDRSALAALAAKARVSDRVDFLGYRRDVAELLAAADVLVSASHSEGLGLVLIEAMQAGCPIAATPVGGCVEALEIDPAGRSPLAEIFSPGDVAGATAAIERALEPSQQRERRIEAARRFAHERFSLARMTERHLDLYQRLASGARGVRPPSAHGRAA
jgi:glycosyltransferase involved in cell wall biosynthesis